MFLGGGGETGGLDFWYVKGNDAKSPPDAANPALNGAVSDQISSVRDSCGKVRDG